MGTDPRCSSIAESRQVRSSRRSEHKPSHSTQAIIPTSNIATLSPYLGRSHLIRDVSSWGTPSSTSAPPAQSNLDNQLGTTNEFSSGYQPTVAIALAATAGCIGVLLISLLTLFRLYKRAGLARPRAHALEVSSPVREWRVNIFRSNNMRIDPFTPGAWVDLLLEPLITPL